MVYKRFVLFADHADSSIFFQFGSASLFYPQVTPYTVFRNAN